MLTMHSCFTLEHRAGSWLLGSMLRTCWWEAMLRHILIGKVTSDIRVGLPCFASNWTPQNTNHHVEMSTLSSGHLWLWPREEQCPLCDHTCPLYSAQSKKEAGLWRHEREEWTRKKGATGEGRHVTEAGFRTPSWRYTLTRPSGSQSSGYLGSSLGVPKGCQWWWGQLPSLGPSFPVRPPAK